MTLKWPLLLASARRKTRQPATDLDAGDAEFRTEFERDYDRVLFSTPVRRLADKTQVFPLDPHDSVRTRLTHSHEVSNLARSFAVQLCTKNLFGTTPTLARDVPSLLAATGLAHDLGNPPFGHQGEEAIRSWVSSKPALLESSNLSEAMKKDFLLFEGNAHTFRLVTKLQLINDNYGLNLTYGTLAALLKYTVPSDGVQEHPARKKPGFFQSEKDIVADVWQKTGLREGVRHPLAYVMEACDDIAYSVLDVEDAVKKGLVSYSDLKGYAEHQLQGTSDRILQEVLAGTDTDHQKYRKDLGLSPSELNDVTMQKLRVRAVSAMVRATSKAFEDNLEPMMSGTFEKDLIKSSAAAVLCKTLKDFAFKHAYKHRSVLEVELRGHNTLHGLMDLLWESITDRKDAAAPASDRNSPFATYAYRRISENYRRIFEDSSNTMPLRYRELQLLADMVAGMTDSFALCLYRELKALHVSSDR